jgi:hypothetical protein
VALVVEVMEVIAQDSQHQELQIPVVVVVVVDGLMDSFLMELVAPE